jgi:epoxide hydrolase-like predicted phosphatase
MKMVKIKAIIFDIGGVLSPKEGKVEPYSFIAKKYGITKEDLERVFYTYFEDYHFNKKLSQYKFWKKTLQELNKNVSDEEIEETIELFNKNMITSPSKKMINLLKSLSEKYYLLLLSNSVRDMDKQIFSSSYIRYFDRMGLSHFNSKKKPLPESYLDIIKGLDLLPEECLFIDDKKINIEGAEKVGMRGIVYTSLSQLIDELKILKIFI